MNIRNATPIVPKSAQEKKELLKLFPVSSGQEHRATEHEWIPVNPQTPVASVTEKKSSEKQQNHMPAAKTAAVIPLQAPQPQPPPLPVAPVSDIPVESPAITTDIQPLPPPPPPPTFNTNTQIDLEIANSWKNSDFGLQGGPPNLSDTAGSQVFAAQMQGQVCYLSFQQNGY